MTENPHPEKVQDLEFVRVPTVQLKTMVAHYRGVLPPEQFKALIGDIRKMFDRYSAVLSGFHPGAERARAAHRLLNTTLEQSNQIKPTCAQGCGACCHLEVEITQDEGELLASVVKGGVEIDRRRLEQQASRERKSPEWALMGVPANRCVFLDAQQACRIYESRPAICRKHLVVSDPAECSKEGGKPSPIFIPLAEVVLSAALSQPGNPYQSLSKSVHAALDGVGKQSEETPLRSVLSAVTRASFIIFATSAAVWTVPAIVVGIVRGSLKG